jgi:hypothetical protein
MPRTALIPLLAMLPLAAWTPRVHETETAKALRMIPKPMADFLRAYPQALIEGARGVANYDPPTAASVEAQFRTVLRMSEEKRRPEDLVRDLGVLARMVQALHDPGCVNGTGPLREVFETYADEKLGYLLVTREPFWATKAPLDPGPHLKAWEAQRWERHLKLRECYDFTHAKRIGPWDDLSVPFAQLQLGFSNAVHATANIWILVYRAAGDQWDLPKVQN